MKCFIKHALSLLHLSTNIRILYDLHWHLLPIVPFTQMHVKLRNLSTQVAPLLHGLLAHSFPPKTKIVKTIISLLTNANLHRKKNISKQIRCSLPDSSVLHDFPDLFIKKYKWIRHSWRFKPVNTSADFKCHSFLSCLNILLLTVYIYIQKHCESTV